MKILPLEPGSDAYDEALRGMVRAERIGDVIAKPETKRYQEYMRLVIDQWRGEAVTDPDDQYRDRDEVPRALEAYQGKHEVELATGCIYVHDEFPVAAAPDAVESDLIGITVHIRRDYGTYRAAVERGVNEEMLRHAQAMMAITKLPFWLHLNYLEIPDQRVRKLHELDVTYDQPRARQLEMALLGFAFQTRARAA